MNSSSAEPDFERMSAFRASTDAWLASISSVTMAGSVSIGAGAPPGGGPAGASSGIDRDEVAALEEVLQRVPDQRIALPHHLQERRAARRRRQSLDDVDEQPPAGLVHRRQRRQLEQREPQGLHRVGHHLLVTD